MAQKKEYRVPVYEYEGGNVVARVRYNQLLDFWNGRNWHNGGLGRHKGITKLQDGRYVIIYGTDWQGERDYGLVCSAEHALQEILKSGHVELLETKKFRALKDLYEKTMVPEVEDEEEH